MYYTQLRLNFALLNKYLKQKLVPETWPEFYEDANIFEKSTRKA